jgi:hypothetical protein
MSNTRTLAAIAAVLIAATLVVGVTFAAAPSAFAWKKGGHDTYKKGGQDNGNGNGNTITIQKNKQYGKQSGHDNTFEQEATNLICTHPNEPCLETD